MTDPTTASPAPAAAVPPVAVPPVVPAAAAAAPVAPAPAPAAVAAAPAPQETKPAVQDFVTEAGATAEVELKAPAGFNIDTKVFSATAKELGISGDKQQMLLDRYAEIETKRAEAASAEFAARNEKWTAEVKADPDIGGAKFSESLTAARRAIKFLGGSDVAKALSEAGLGNHPTLVRAFVKLGRSLGEDSVVGSGGSPPKVQKTLTELLYPTMVRKDR